MRLFTGGATVSDPRDPKSTTPLRQIVGHVAMTATKGSAWYRLAPVPWSFRPDRDRESHLINQAVVTAQLTGKKIHIRRTTTPFPVRAWAEQHHSMVVAKGKPYGAAPLPCWPDLLEGEQRQFLGEHQSEKEVFVGVDFLRRSMLNEYASAAVPEPGGAAEPGVAPPAPETGRAGHPDAACRDERLTGHRPADGVVVAPQQLPGIPRAGEKARGGGRRVGDR